MTETDPTAVCPPSTEPAAEPSHKPANENTAFMGHRLGRLPNRSDKRTLNFANYRKATVSVPAASEYWKNKAGFAPETWGNNELGDCTIAKQANMFRRFQRIEHRKTIAITTEVVKQTYFQMTSELYGGGDTGAYEEDALGRSRKPETCLKDTEGRNLLIDAYVRVDAQNHDELRAAIAAAAGHGIAVCLNLPTAYQNIKPPTPWPGPLTGVLPSAWMPGSWGGHCLAADTPIPLLNGETVSIGDLAAAKSRNLWVYGSDANGKFVPTQIREAVRTKRARTITVILDDETRIRATPEHPFMLREGAYLPAGKLTPGTSLMPCYRRVNDEGYEEILTAGEWVVTHLAVGETRSFQRGHGWVAHHVDFDKRNNEPTNLQNMTWEEHTRLHAECAKLLNDYARSEEGRTKSRELMTALWANPEWRERMVKIIRPWEKSSLTHAPGWFASEEGRQFALQHGNSDRNIEHMRRQAEAKKNRVEYSCHYCGKPVVRTPAFVAKSGRVYCSREHYFAGRWGTVPTNHKVAAIEPGKTEDVFDLIGSNPTHNFAAGGVYVHNSMWAIGYNKTGIWLEHTWGYPPQLITWAGAAAYLDEAHIVVDSVDSWKKKVTKGQFDIAAVVADVNAVSTTKIGKPNKKK